MVRLGLIVMVLALAGCSALRDAVSANAKVAGTAQVGALPQYVDRDARQTHARPGGLGVRGGQRATVPAHPDPDSAERRADGGATEGEGGQRGAGAGRGQARAQLRAARPSLF